MFWPLPTAWHADGTREIDGPQPDARGGPLTCILNVTEANSAFVNVYNRVTEKQELVEIPYRGLLVMLADTWHAGHYYSDQSNFRVHYFLALAGFGPAGALPVSQKRGEIGSTSFFLPLGLDAVRLLTGPVDEYCKSEKALAMQRDDALHLATQSVRDALDATMKSAIKTYDDGMAQVAVETAVKKARTTYKSGINELQIRLGVSSRDQQKAYAKSEAAALRSETVAYHKAEILRLGELTDAELEGWGQDSRARLKPSRS